MKLLILITVWIFGVQIAFAESLSPPVQHGGLNVGDSLTLKDVFDGGFRPYLVTNAGCRIGESFVSLKSPEGEQLMAHLKAIDFNVTKDDTVTWMILTTDALLPSDSQKQVADILRFFRTEPAGWDYAFEKSSLSNGRVLTQNFMKGEARVSVSIQPTTYYVNKGLFGSRELRVIMTISFNWKVTGVGPTLRKAPITPPLGYEHISMQLPTTDFLISVQGSKEPAYAHLQIEGFKRPPAPKKIGGG